MKNKKNRINFDRLQIKLKISFKNPALLKEALTHRSYLNEYRGRKLSSNERLEFLGDAILEFITSEFLFSNFPTRPEGELTNIRSNIVCTSSLAGVAKNLNLGQHLLLSKGELESGGQRNKTLLANTFEALVGAIYLDQGLNTVKKFIDQNLLQGAKKNVKKIMAKDYKSLLQEKTQAKTKQSPEYRLLKEEGPDHDKTFTVGVYLSGKIQGKGMGRSKQEAEQNAAFNALEKRIQL